MVNLVFEGNKKLGGFYGCDEDSDGKCCSYAAPECLQKLEYFFLFNS
jgi:hypothetical protein